MPDTEKITINLSVVDLGKIDLLVEEGFYSNRTDLIRTAIRNQLERHADAVEDAVVRRSSVLGVLIYDRRDLEHYYERGEMLDMRVVGLLSLTKDVTPELALATIQSIHVLGVFNAGNDVQAALKEAGRLVG